jgi:hypothetical protein
MVEPALGHVVEPSFESAAPKDSPMPPLVVQPGNRGALYRGGVPGNKANLGRKIRREYLGDITDRALKLVDQRVKSGDIYTSELIALVKADLAANHGDQINMIQQPTLLKLMGVAMNNVGLAKEAIAAVGEELKRLIAESEIELLNDTPMVIE